MTSEMTPSGNLRFHVFGLDAYIGFGSYNEESTYAGLSYTSCQNRCNHGQIYNAHHVLESQTSLLYRE